MLGKHVAGLCVKLEPMGFFFLTWSLILGVTLDKLVFLGLSFLTCETRASLKN